MNSKLAIGKAKMWLNSCQKYRPPPAPKFRNVQLQLSLMMEVRVGLKRGGFLESLLKKRLNLQILCPSPFRRPLDTETQAQSRMALPYWSQRDDVHIYMLNAEICPTSSFPVSFHYWTSTTLKIKPTSWQEKMGKLSQGIWLAREERYTGTGIETSSTKQPTQVTSLFWRLRLIHFSKARRISYQSLRTSL